MVEDVAIDFEDLLGELRELYGRVVAFELRDERDQVVAEGEGEFHDLSVEPGMLSFQLGGVPDRVREGVRFRSSSHTVVRVDFAGARRIYTGIGPVMLVVRTAAGMRINLWPAMPPRSQYTDQHDDDR